MRRLPARRLPVRRLTVVVMVVIALAGVGLSGCGSSSGGGSSIPSGTTHFAKTKFLFHTGLAYGAFHRYVYAPFRAGDFRHPFLHKLTLVKAGLAAVFIDHELKLAATDARSSRILRALVSPLTVAAAAIGALKGSIVSGSVSSADLSGVQSKLTQIGRTAAAKGQTIKEALPSASQLASAG